MFATLRLIRTATAPTRPGGQGYATCPEAAAEAMGVPTFGRCASWPAVASMSGRQETGRADRSRSLDLDWDPGRRQRRARPFDRTLGRADRSPHPAVAWPGAPVRLGSTAASAGAPARATRRGPTQTAGHGGERR